MKNRLTLFTKYLLDAMFWLGIACEAALPWLIKIGGRFYPHLRDYYLLHVILLLISGAGAIVIVFELRRMFRTVLAGSCFVRENVTSLRRMGWVSMGIAAVTAVRVAVLITPATLIIVAVFFIAGLFSFVLAGVFDQAVSYKEDSDFTI